MPSVDRIVINEDGASKTLTPGQRKALPINTSVSTMHDVIAEIQAQAEMLSEFAERAVSHPSADDRTTDAKTLAEMASNLNAMISVFTIERRRDRRPDATELAPKAESATSNAATDCAAAAYDESRQIWTEWAIAHNGDTLAGRTR